MKTPTRRYAVITALFCLAGVGCGRPVEESGAPEDAASPVEDPATAAPAQIRFANHCSATGPEVTLVNPAEAPEWEGSESQYCVVFEDTPDHYGNFDPLGLEGPCGGGDALPPWESSKELFVVITGAGDGSRTLHVGTRIEETDDERCVGCYPEEAGCEGTSTFRELSRDVSLAIPEGGGSRVVPLTEIQGLDYERKVLSLTLTLELLEGDSAVARDSLKPVWARCC